MIVAAIVARLKETGTPFALVAEVADLASVEKRPSATPAAYVFIKEDAAGENERMTGPVLQRIEADVAVVLITDNLTDGRMGTASTDIEALKTWTRSKVIGFTPTMIDEPVTYVGGQIVKARSGTVWWEELYGASFYIEEQA